MRKYVMSILAASMATVGSAYAETKIGTVDLNKIFESYYKTAEAKARIGESEAAYRKDRQIKMEDYQKLVDEVNKLREDAQNPALAGEVKEQKTKAFQEKIKEVQLREREIMQFDNQRRGELQNTMLRQRNAIVEEITAKIKDYAAKNGFTFVFDKTGQSAAGAPMVVYAVDAVDFSPEIIKQLNASKPAGGAPAASTPPPAPAAK
jgi:outer membrane protein